MINKDLILIKDSKMIKLMINLKRGQVVKFIDNDKIKLFKFLGYIIDWPIFKEVKESK